MRIRQMGFSSRLKAHRHLLTLETLKFIYEYLIDGNAKQAAIRSGIPENYAARQGQWLKKHPIVNQALAKEYDEDEVKDLGRRLQMIENQIHECKKILNLEEV